MGTKFDDFVQLPIDLQWTIANQVYLYSFSILLGNFVSTCPQVHHTLITQSKVYLLISSPSSVPSIFYTLFIVLFLLILYVFILNKNQISHVNLGGIQWNRMSSFYGENTTQIINSYFQTQHLYSIQVFVCLV